MWSVRAGGNPGTGVAGGDAVDFEVLHTVARASTLEYWNLKISCNAVSQYSVNFLAMIFTVVTSEAPNKSDSQITET